MSENLTQVVLLVTSGYCCGFLTAWGFLHGHQTNTSSHQGGRQSQEKGSDDLTVIPKKTLDLLEGILAGIAFLVLGWGLSMVVEGNGSSWTYWRVVALALSFLYGLTLIVIATILQHHE